MGNSSTKEHRPPSSPESSTHRHDLDAANVSTERSPNPLYASRPGRGSRPDLSFLGLGSNSNAEGTETRRETKQERNARKLAEERVAREKERERSMKEEHVDGGYLVTQGVYTGTEDFSKTVVRQLMIERRVAPFWRGLNDFNGDWTENQLVAAARGLAIPAADEIPQEDPKVFTASETQKRPSTPNLQNLMVPITDRSPSAASEASGHLSTSDAPNSMPFPSSSLPLISGTVSSFRPRSKTLASLTSSKPPAQNDMTPRETQLPHDPYVNGLRMEAFLYKDATECPICFIYYPPYLNRTRCCDQAICSECFVQIKRPDPHPPEHEHNDPANPAPIQAIHQENPETLVSEPANCPYCQQPELGVTYEPPPFRRGLTYAGQGIDISAMSSSTSLSSLGSPVSTVVPSPKRRTTSISANASTVVTTDRVRPDWATKLANARNHAARRSAAATALHTAAYLMGNGGSDGRGFAFSSRSRFGRSRGDGSGGSGSATPAGGPDIATRMAAYNTLAEQHATRSREGGISSRRRSRMDDLEDMMMMEAIRLSLAAEEERKRKEDKEAAKAAKKKDKAERKAEKAAEKNAKKSLYSGSSSASASALSLSGIGRRRGNSGSSGLLREAQANSAEKGKAVDRGNPGEASNSGSAPIDIGTSIKPLSFARNDSRNVLDIPHIESATPSPTTATAPERPSHLRQMSNASSPASSFMDSIPESLHNDANIRGSSFLGGSPNASGTHLSSTPDAEGGTGTEPMFNFRSLAAMVGLEDEKDEKNGHFEHSESKDKEQGENSPSADVVQDSMEQSVATLKVGRPDYKDD